jgi:RND family efflux transporter MFP subunit
MMKKVLGKTIVIVVVATFIVIGLYNRFQSKRQGARSSVLQAVPVEVSNIEIGTIRLLRTYSGTLEPHNAFLVSSKVGGRIEKIEVDIADPIKAGDVVARIENDEFVQELTQAKANLDVASANLAQAESALEIAQREFDRKETLRQKGVASDAEHDTAKTALLTQKARVQVAQAELSRAESAVEIANIRLGYTNVIANWSNGDSERVVAERYIDEGQTVTANTALLKIVELSPITGVITVTEKEYPLLHTDQKVMVQTDAYPGENFEGTIRRIAPVFRENSRQARVELEFPNTDRRLKPGMFIRASVQLAQKENATLLPEAALTIREDQQGVFVVNQDSETVSWKTVTVGIREGKKVEVSEEGLGGQVVTIGQQLIQDGSKVLIANADHAQPIQEK